MHKLLRFPLFIALVCGLLADADAQTITATKDDGVPGTSRKLPGESIIYTINIQNTGGTTATGVMFADPDPANTSFVSVFTTPIARNDAYSAIGNVQISIGAPGLLANDNDADAVGPALTVTAINTAGTQGNVTFAANGSFTFNPAAGFTGTTTFGYTMSDGEGNTDTATVTVTVTGLIWFVDENAASNGDGRLGTPFSTMANFVASPLDEAGDNIFLYSGPNYVSGITLLANQRLIGQGATVTLQVAAGIATIPTGSAALPSTGLARPTIAVTSGTGVTLGSGNNVQGLNVTNSNGSGIAGSAVGTLTLADFDATVTNGTALNLTTSGTVTATGTDNDLSSTNGTALNVNAVTIAAAGITFKSISSSGGSATGIILDTTGSLGGLTVTGDGTNTTLGGNSTGGTIANKTGADGNPATGSGIYFNATRTVTLRRLTINGTNQNYGIRGIGVSAFVMEYCTIGGTNGTNQGNPFNEGSINFAELTGTSSIKSSNISGGFLRNVAVDNTAGALNLTVSDNNIHNTGNTAGDDGLFIEIGDPGVSPAATGTLRVTGNTLSAHGGDHFDLSLFGSPTVSLVFTGNHGNPGSPVHPIGLGQGFRVLGAAFNGTFTYDFRDNDIYGTKQGGAMTVNKGSGTGTFSGRVANNVIGLAGVTLSGASQSNGINVESRGGGTHTTLVTGNTVRQYREYGINIEGAEAGATTFNVTCTANTIEEPGGPGAAGLSLHGIQLNWGIDVGNTSVCLLDLGGAGALRNIVPNGGNEPAGGVDIRLRQRQATTVRLLNYVGAPNDNAAVQTYITGRNTLTSVLASNTVPTGQGYLNTASVPQPTIPLLFAAGEVGATEVVSAATGADVDVDSATQENGATAVPSAGSRVTPKQTLDGSELSQAQLNEVVALATSRWEATGLTEEQRGVLRRMKFETADLPGLRLGEANSNHIRVDSNAAGNAWFIDRNGDTLVAGKQTPGVSPLQVDLLTTIMHEMGHALGLSDSYLEQDSDNVMYGFLSKGQRRLPAHGQAIGAEPNEKSGPHFLTTPLNIGDLPPGKTVAITYTVTINPTSAISISNQGTVSGGNFSPVVTDDPQFGGTQATVTPVQQPPVVTDVSKTTNEDAPLTFVATDFTGSFSDPNNDGLQVVKITSLPANGTLTLSTVPVTAGQDIALGSIDTLQFVPATNFNGSTSFGWNGRDGTLFALNAATVNITVNAVNDKPTFSASNPPAVNEDAGAQTVTGFVSSFSPGPANESSQTVLGYTVSNVSNPSLFAAGPAIDPSGNLTYTPAANANGSSTFDVRAQDSGGTANNGVDTSDAQTFTIAINAVNDQPSFTASNPPAVPEDAGPRLVSGFASFNPGAANETGQAVLAYTVSNVSNPGLFSSGPAVANNGDLTYTPAPHTSGTSTFEVTVQDNGGTAGGGIDTSAPQTFTITVNEAICFATPADLLAWYPGEGNAIDVKGGRDGTLLTGAGYGAGQVGQAFTFVGAAAVVQIADDPVWDFGANAFTITTWVKFNAISGSDVFVAHDEGGGVVDKWIFWLRNGKLGFHINGTAQVFIESNATFTPNAGQWYHVAVTRSGSTYQFYLDGVQNGIDQFGSDPVPAADAPLTLGQAEALPALNGSLDEVQIYNRALAGTEVQSIYNSSSEGLCVDALAATSAVSRKTHGAVGDFDVPLPFTGEPGVESRVGSAPGNHKIVVLFNNAVTEGSASVSAGSVSGTPTFDGKEMTINLTGVPNAQQITVSLSNVKDAFGQVIPSATVKMNVLVGDSTGNKLVSASDVSQTKALSGDPTDITKFRCDFNTDGSVNASDVSQVKFASGKFIP